MKKAIFTIAVLCGIGLMAGCKSGTANENTTDTVVTVADTVKTNFHFRPICADGFTYGYVSAMTYGVSGNHERIMVQSDTNNIDSNYIFYGDVIYLTHSCDMLAIHVPDVFVKKNAVFDDPFLEVLVLDRLMADSLANWALKQGYYEINVHDPLDDTIFLQ